MRFWVFSDLHLDGGGQFKYQPPPGTDAVLIAGDVCDPKFTVDLPTFFVAGNHEFYRSSIPAVRERIPDNWVSQIGDVRVIGATLWTDYDLYGAPEASMSTARFTMNDHRRISWKKDPWERFTPQHARKLHWESRAFIEQELRKDHRGPTVILTHHAPSPRSIHPSYGQDLLNAAYASDLEELILAFEPDLWVHGHVHTNFDYTIGMTHVICNPHGYRDENPEFDPQLVVDL